MGEVAESEGDASQVFDASVDGFGGSVRGPGMVEVGGDVAGTSGDGPGQFP